MIELSPKISLRLPQWAAQTVLHSVVYRTNEEKMGLVLDLLSSQIDYGTGYPFASAIFEKSHRILAVGVNYSVALNNSTAHAEMLALQFAQGTLNKPYLPKSGEYTLVTSAQPCAMCIGAIYSSGIRQIVVGARECDIEEIMKFGQGPVHPQWREFLAAKEIQIVEDVERERARSLMQKFVTQTSRPHKKIEQSTSLDLPGQNSGVK